jgi:hypothetical protein
MIKPLTLINPVCFIKLLVYNTVFAVILLLSLLLVSSNLYNLKSQISLRYLLPTVQFLELYQKIVPAFQFVVTGYIAITTLAGAWTVWINFKRHTEYTMELKYSSYFVILVTQAFLVINFSGISKLLIAMVVFFLFNSIVFLWSNRLDSRTKILDNKARVE